MTYRKKLLEVALPLDAINKASAREKSIRHGHIPARCICGGHGDHWKLKYWVANEGRAQLVGERRGARWRVGEGR